VTKYLFKWNVLTISGEDGDELTAPGLQADFSAICGDYLFKRNVLTISDEDGDRLAAPGLQADFLALCDGLFIRAECAYCW
jgi:hypothetical protein